MVLTTFTPLRLLNLRAVLEHYSLRALRSVDVLWISTDVLRVIVFLNSQDVFTR